MSIFVPITTYIQYGEISAYLAAAANSKNILFKGGALVPTLSEKIEIVRKAIQWKYNLEPLDESLNDTCLYLYALCGRYVIQAQHIINEGVTGDVIDPNTGNLVTIATPNPQFRVGDPGALMTAGETTITFGYAGVVNPSLEITLDGVEIPYGDPVVVSFTATYTPTDVQVVFNAPVQNGWLLNFHLIQLIPV
jgi:hypothetical protein